MGEKKQPAPKPSARVLNFSSVRPPSQPPPTGPPVNFAAELLKANKRLHEYAKAIIGFCDVLEQSPTGTISNPEVLKPLRETAEREVAYQQTLMAALREALKDED